MNHSSQQAKLHGHDQGLGVYECEIKLKFRLIEENLGDCDREDLIRTLVDAYAYGSDEYLESLDSKVKVQALGETEASPQMRRQLMRLRNSSSSR
ncbi:MAG: Npun_R1517 family heterocyst differentiation transcriptional regulator [Cyanobacteria bacterium]|nr:Npun_R1517 family heterocyst differentiation transcriptional regulator [Cyanobacteriota bacterium]MDA0866890.1 Npun_R1517 family heterocyst differentiation transcriptional regulator [Cyanobacteriota bacterium]